MAGQRFTQEDLDRLARGERPAGPQRYSIEEGRRLFSGAPAAQPEPAPRSKMGNEPQVYNGVRYDSTAEARYAQGLDFKERAGLVLRWERQVVFSLDVAGVHIANYRLDFRVFLADGTIEHVDVKGQKSGVPYDLFTAKKRLMLAVHGIVVLER